MVKTELYLKNSALRCFFVSITRKYSDFAIVIQLVYLHPTPFCALPLANNYEQRH